jgi:hypothetical protein
MGFVVWFGRFDRRLLYRLGCKYVELITHGLGSCRYVEEASDVYEKISLFLGLPLLGFGLFRDVTSVRLLSRPRNLISSCRFVHVFRDDVSSPYMGILGCVSQNFISLP